MQGCPSVMNIIDRPSNKGLERTRRVGVPASRAVIRVSPCSSTQCWADISGSDGGTATMSPLPGLETDNHKGNPSEAL